MKQLLLLLLSAFSLQAQTPDLEDLSLITENSPLISFLPPTGPVRCMAEWEELQALCVSWTDGQQGVIAEIVRAARQECNVIISCKSQQAINSAKNYLTTKGIDWSSNVTFLVNPFNTVWIRDYGPNCVYANDVDSLLIVDWIYNRENRSGDDNTPLKIAEKLSLPIFRTNIAPYDLVGTGGNFMSDGMGTGFSSKLIFRNNNQVNDPECTFTNDLLGTSNHTEAGVDSIMYRFMGIDRYIKMEELPYDCIHHIDMHIKLLDEQTLLVGQYPQGIADGPQIEANLQYVINNFKSAFGAPFKVIRIPMPPNFAGDYPPDTPYYTYVNATVVNKSILVPVYGLPTDEAALEAWKQAMPGYKIVGINAGTLIPSDGAIHCVTKEIGVNDPLRIVHQPLECQDATVQDGYIAKALIQHRSGIDAATLWYRVDSATTWTPLPMQSLSSMQHHWGALIPKQTVGSTIQYYIEANAVSGKSLNRPLPAPEAFWSFCIKSSVDVAEAQHLKVEEIYPNPASGITAIPLNSSTTLPAEITLYNALGQYVRAIFNGNLPTGKSTHFLDASGLPAGTYFVSIKSGNQVQSKKIMVR